ncbi:hypothetical protein [Streptomyces luteireticuli]|uniref:hypothetical protein n=1 Tax=Streptomyces luteireticuli TaxID=173858 RepID=UPI0035585676
MTTGTSDQQPQVQYVWDLSCDDCYKILAVLSAARLLGLTEIAACARVLLNEHRKRDHGEQG